MARSSALPLPILLILLLTPLVAVSATWWMVSSLDPACTIAERQRLTAPDGAHDLVVFSRQCEFVEPNTRAILVAAGQQVPLEATGFAAVAADIDLAPRWDGFGNVEVTVPDDAPILARDETASGIDIIYR